MPAQAVSTRNLRDIVEEKYLAMLPELQKLSWLRHRYLPPDERQEAQAECYAWSWSWCLSAAARGKLDELNPRMLTLYALKMWRVGRRFAASASSDVLSPAARVSGRVHVASLDACNREDSDHPATLGMTLSDSRHLRPEELARINVDYRVALRRPSVPRKGRRLFGHLVRDNSFGHARRIARQMKISPPRICQLKEKLRGALESIGYGISATTSDVA